MELYCWKSVISGDKMNILTITEAQLHYLYANYEHNENIVCFAIGNGDDSIGLSN